MRWLAQSLALTLLGCAGGEPTRSLKVGDALYRVPVAQITSLTEEPHQFVRIKPPDRNFELIYDSRTAVKTDRFGWPVIFSLNDERAPGIHRHARGNLMVVCRQAVHPNAGCGVKVAHRGAEWSVLFADAHLEEALVIRHRALAALTAYEASFDRMAQSES